MQFHQLEQGLAYRFQQRPLLLQALTHRSFGTPHNERLEFLGDSILNCVVASLLFRRFANLREGDLSRLRANLVRQESLHRIAEKLKLGDFLRLGEGELKSGGFRRPSILADALEAVFGAIYLDAGFETAQQVIESLCAEAVAQIDPKHAGKDPKTTLQEYLQGRHMSLPMYTLVGTHGEAHAQGFDVECVIVELNLRTQGSGSSRRAAEQEAARQAMICLNSKQ